MTKIVIAGGNDNYCLEIALAQPDDEIHLPDCLPKYGVQMIMQETSHEELEDLAEDLPTDTHLCTYRYPDGATGVDAVRSYCKSDIFDAYHDSGLTVLEIRNGYGRRKPGLWVDAQEKKK